MAQFVVFTAHRDGTGKSTIVANAAWIAARRGLKVGAIDADLFGPGLHVTLGLGPELAGKTINDHLESQCAVDEATREIELGSAGANPRGRLLLLPASSDPDRLLRIAQRGFDADRVARAARTLAEQQSLDLVFIDAPAGLRQESLLIASLADLLVVTLRPDSQDFHGTAGLLQAARALGSPQVQVLANKASRRIDTHAMRPRLEQVFGRSVAGILPLEEDLAALGSRRLFAAAQPAHRFTRLLEHALDQVLLKLPHPLVREQAAS